MFNGKDLGSWQEGVGAEDYGPPAPTEQQKTGQAILDIAKSEVPLTKNTIYYVIGGVTAVYFAWEYLFKDMISDESQY